MNLIQSNPMKNFERYFDHFNRLSRLEDDLQAVTQSDWVPSVDICEEDDEFLIKVEVPEVRKEDMHIQIDNGLLSIRGKRHLEQQDKKHHRLERGYGSFNRSFTLPENVHEDGISAEQKNGMLYLHLKKDKQKKVKAIEIQVKDKP